MVPSYHGSGRQVGLKLGTDNTAISMGAGDFSPYASVMRAIFLHLRLIDVSHALTAIPRHFLFGVNPLDLD